MPGYTKNSGNDNCIYVNPHGVMKWEDRRTQKQTDCSTQNLFKTKRGKQSPRGGKTRLGNKH